MYCPYDERRICAQRGRNPCICQHGARFTKGAVTLVIHCHHRRPTPSDAAARLSLFLPGPSNYFAACVTPPTKTPPRFASSNAVITSNNERGNPAVSQLTLGAAARPEVNKACAACCRDNLSTGRGAPPPLHPVCAPSLG